MLSAVVAIGAVGRTLRAPWYAVLAAQLLGVVLWLDHRYAAADAWAGWIPTPTSFSAVADRIHHGAVAVNTYASPVSAEHTETYAYLLATSMLVLLSTDLLACGLRRVPWAGLPVIVALTVPISVLEAGLSWVVGNAECLPFPDRSFDAYTIAFGLRNVTDIDAALREARRVLKPGGRFFCLEFSRVAVAPLRVIYDRYSDIVIPRLGEIVAKDRESYAYLVESIRRFPEQQALIGRMEQAGFAFSGYRNLSAGIAAIHHGRRI